MKRILRAGTVVLLLSSSSFWSGRPAAADGGCAFIGWDPIIVWMNRGVVEIAGEGEAVCTHAMDTVTVNGWLYACKGFDARGSAVASATNTCHDAATCSVIVTYLASSAGSIWSWHTDADGSWKHGPNSTKQRGDRYVSTCLNVYWRS